MPVLGKLWPVNDPVTPTYISFRYQRYSIMKSLHIYFVYPQHCYKYNIWHVAISRQTSSWYCVTFPSGNSRSEQELISTSPTHLKTCKDHPVLRLYAWNGPPLLPSATLRVPGNSLEIL
jgi:hypothetical protein